MKIYLDSKDLISIFQNGHPCSVAYFQEYLSEGSHELVVSSSTIIEISAPLSNPHSQTNVMALLNKLEEMPILYLHPDIRGQELKEGLDAFSSRREYRAVTPFVKRFDETLDLSAAPGTSKFLNYPLAAIVWDLYSQGGLKKIDNFATPMKAIVASDRKMPKLPNLKSHFVTVIQRNLRDDRLSCSDTKGFANWIYKNPNRCPAIRMAYEVWYQIVKNKTDALEDSDMEDYQHLNSLPYVDLITLDRRMSGYVTQAARRMQMDISGRIHTSIQKMLELHVDRSSTPATGPTN